MPSSSRRQLEDWLKEIDVPSGSFVLDVGGAQKPVKGRTKSWEGTHYSILDLEVPHEDNAGAVDRITGDIESQEYSIPQGVEGAFDVAFCLEVSEYWINPLQALKNISRYLPKGGTLYISFHFVYPMHAPLSQDSLRYTRYGVLRLLDEAGFNDVEITERVADWSNMLVGFYQDEGMKPAHGENHSVTGWLIKCKKQ